MSSASSHAPRGLVNGGGSRARALPSRGGRAEVAGYALRYAGALSVLIVGVIHAQQYYYAYFSVVPTIGTLFLLSFIGSAVFGVVLLAPVRRLGRNLGDLALVLASLGGIGVAAGSLVSLLISEYTPLFGFMESGYRLAIVLTLVFDSLTTASLAAFLVLLAYSRRQRRTSSRTRGMTREP